jgi:glycosyltransferase involved in cell wall biosynthesis
MKKEFIEMQIGLVGPLPPPSGGMANQTHLLAQLLRDEGAIVHIIQVNAPYRPTWIGKVRGMRELFRLIPYLFQLWMATEKVDIFHIMANSGWSWHLVAAPAVWMARLRGIPVVVNYRGGGAESFLNRSFSLVNLTLKRAKRIVVPSVYLMQIFAKWDVPSTIVPNVIDLTRFNPKGRPINEKTNPISRDCKKHIIVTRNLEQIYDIGAAIRAFRLVQQRLPEVRLTIAGSGSEFRKLESLVIEFEMDDKVTFTGRLDNHRMAQLYNSADVMLNPSTVDNMPISILEALASGVPVVSTDVGGVPYVVEDGKTAVLVPVGDYKAMAEELVKMLTDDALARRISSAGLEVVKKYTWPQVKHRWLEVYGTCMDMNNNQAATALEDDM